MKIKVKEKDYVSLLQETARKLKAGEITFGQAEERAERISADQGIFGEHVEKTRVSPTVKTAPRISFFNTQEAADRHGGAYVPEDRETLQKTYEAVVAATPGDNEFDQLADPQAQVEMKRFHDLHDGFTLMASLKPGWKPPQAKNWGDYNRLATKLSKRVLGEDRFNRVAKIMTSGGASTGADFIPSTLSGTLVPLFRQELVLGTAFPHIPMPTSPYILPLEGVDTKPYLIAEASDDNPATSANAINARTPATSKVTLTAIGLKVRGVVSTEVEEDAIISNVAYMRSKFARAIAEGVDDAIVNGDTSGTHFDADSNTTNDWRHSWLGLRKLTATSGTPAAKYDNGAAKLTVAKLLNVKRAFGKFGQMPSDQLIIVSPVGLIHIMGDTAFARWDALGQVPPLVTGQVGTIFGSPVVQSAYCRQDLNHAGVYDGSGTTKTMALVVHRPSFALGDRRQISIQSMLDIQTDKFIVVATWRGTFARIQAETTSPQVSRNVGFVYNIDGASSF